MKARALGRVYKSGHVIFRQGDVGDCMYVIEAGQVEVCQETLDGEMQLALLGVGDFFGDMAIFDRTARSATVRAVGDTQLLTVDKKTLLRRITEDPSLAFRIVQKMSQRIKDLNAELARLGGQTSANG